MNKHTLFRYTSILLSLGMLLVLTNSALANDTERLSRGEILVQTINVTNSNMPKLIVRGVINVAPAKVWEIVGDCERYPNTLPRVKSAKVVEKTGNTIVCDTTIGLPFPLSDVTAVTSAKIVTGPPAWTRTWTLVSGDYESNNGSWKLENYNDAPNKTLVTYTIHAVPSTSLPAWAVRRAQKSSAPDLIKALRDALEK